MKILKLRKIKLGDRYPIIRVTYKKFLIIRHRDVIKDTNIFRWKWADIDYWCLNDLLLDAFNESGEREYVLNIDNN